MKGNIDVGELVAEIRNLDFRDIGSWSAAVRMTVIALCCALLGFLGYWFVIKTELATLTEVRAREPELLRAFEQKQQQVANIDAYKQQLETMRIAFSTMLRQLPSETEVANLLQDISNTRVSVGLEEELFKPENERPKEFYAEAPIRIRVLGDYHQFGEFASGIAALPRIVTLNEISIRPAGGEGDVLVMDAIAMTYRYLDESESGT